MLAVQRLLGRQAEDATRPGAGRRFRCGHRVEQVADNAMRQQRRDDHQAAVRQGGMDVRAERRIAQQGEQDRGQDGAAQHNPCRGPPGAADQRGTVVAALRFPGMPGFVGQDRQGEQRDRRGQHQGADRRQGAAIAALGERQEGDFQARAADHQSPQARRQMLGAGIGEVEHAASRPGWCQHRRAEADYEQHDDDARDDMGDQDVDRRRRLACQQQPAEEPDGKDRHQDQPEPVDGGGDGAVMCAVQGAAHLAVAKAQGATTPP